MAGAATTAATVVAKTASGTGLPGALVYLKFQATVGGGSAAVGGVRLTSSYQGFVADGSGQVVVQYTTPSVLPRGGKDVLTAANSSSGASSTDTSTYSFTTTAHWRFAPEPMGSPGSLRPGETVDVVATALDASWQPVPDAQVCLLLKAISGGGTATVAGVALTSKFRCFTGDAAGAVHVAYQVPLQLPATGMDEIDVRDTTSSLYNTSSFHGYSFGQLSQVTFAPSEIAAPGSLLPGAKVSLTLTPRDQTGAQVAGATIRLWLVSSTGAKGTVTSYSLAPDGIYLSNSPKVFVSHTKTKMVVSYQFSKSAPGSGTDTVYAQVESADGSVTSQAAAQYTWGS